MNLLSQALNALTFANVNTLGELRSQLRKVDVPASPQQRDTPCVTSAPARNAAAAVPHGAQGAL